MFDDSSAIPNLVNGLTRRSRTNEDKPQLAIPCVADGSVVSSEEQGIRGNSLQFQTPSLLNSPELRFVCEEVRSGTDGRQNRSGYAVC